MGTFPQPANGMSLGEQVRPDAIAADGAVPPVLLAAHLTRSRILSRCSRQEIARLLPLLRESRLAPGDVLCRAGQPASDIWLVLQGTLRLKRADDSWHDISEGLVGEEAALGIGSYLADIVAVDEVTVAALRKEVVPSSLTAHSSRAQAFGRSVVRAFAPAPFDDVVIPATGDSLLSPIALSKLVGWIAAVISPIALLWMLESSSLRWEQRQLSAVLVSTAMLWIFGAVAPYVAGLLVVLTCVTLGLVPNAVVLSGFASNGFFLALSAFSLGAVLIESGAINRGFLLLMKYCPRSAPAYDLAALLAGLVLTPIVPSAVERARVLAPLVTESAHTLGYGPASRERTRLTLSMFMGLTLFSPMLLTGSPLNLVLYGSLPEQVQDAFPWLQWAIAALAAFVVMLGAFLTVYFLVFRDGAAPRLARHVLGAQLDLLGPVASREWLAIGGVVLFLGAVATVSVHKIDHRLIALTVVCGYLVLGTLGKDQLNLRIDWSALILLGTLIGVIATIVHVDLHTAIAARLVALSDLMKYSPRVFVAILAGSVVLAGLCIPLAGALIAVVVVPLAIVNGMSPWVVVFVILLMSDIWIWPYQSEVYRMFRSIVGSDGTFDERSFLQFNAAMAVARVLALVASMAYWESMRVV